MRDSVFFTRSLIFLYILIIIRKIPYMEIRKRMGSFFEKVASNVLLYQDKITLHQQTLDPMQAILLAFAS